MCYVLSSCRCGHLAFLCRFYTDTAVPARQRTLGFCHAERPFPQTLLWCTVLVEIIAPDDDVGVGSCDCFLSAPSRPCWAPVSVCASLGHTGRTLHCSFCGCCL
ncbi:unnamed protein product, partial [Ectocarpus sp. 12 AP-2014]